MTGGDGQAGDGRGGNRRGAVAAIVLVLLLVAGGLWISRRLSDVGQLQDCVASGRHDCGTAATNRP